MDFVENEMGVPPSLNSEDRITVVSRAANLRSQFWKTCKEMGFKKRRMK